MVAVCHTDRVGVRRRFKNFEKAGSPRFWDVLLPILFTVPNLVGRRQIVRA